MSKLILAYTALCIGTSIALYVMNPPPPFAAPTEETRRHQRVRMRRPVQRFTRRARP